MHLSKEQQVFVVKSYFEFRSYAHVINDFRQQFSDTNVPSKSTIQRNVSKFNAHGEIFSKQKSNSSIGTQFICSEVRSLRYRMETCLEKGGRQVEGVVN